MVDVHLEGQPMARSVTIPFFSKPTSTMAHICELSTPPPTEDAYFQSLVMSKDHSNFK